MSLTEGDRAIVREIGAEIGMSMAKTLKEQWKGDLKTHYLTCPTTKAVANVKFAVLGAVVGGLIVGGTGTVGLLKVLSVI